MRDYSWPLFRADALAGVSVALVALPLCIAIAIASGSTPFVGLVTAFIGGFVISATSGSRVQIGGPTGASIAVVFGVIDRKSSRLNSIHYGAARTRVSAREQ